MKLFDGIYRYMFVSGGRRRLFSETMVALVIAFIRVRFSPFHQLAKALGRKGGESPKSIAVEKLHVAKEIERAIATISLYLPWPPSCLIQAVTAHRLLRRRNIACTIYFGVASGPGQGRAVINAHAWLRCGSRIITGRNEANLYKVIACFAS